MASLIRFSYLVSEFFSFFFMMQTVFLVLFIMLLAASEGIFGPVNSALVRLYFNILDH